MKRLITVLSVTLTLLATALVAQAAPGDASLNARLIRWPYTDAAVHIIVPYGDNGTGGTTAHVSEYEQLLFGFEFVDPDLESLENFIATLTVTVSIDGAPAVDVSDAFLEPFYSTGSGPRWTWDHDADGPGDGNENGVGDFPSEHWVAPFRYAHDGLAAGPHTFVFILDYGNGTWFGDTVLFQMSG